MLLIYVLYEINIYILILTLLIIICTMYVYCQKLSNLLLPAFETEKKRTIGELCYPVFASCTDKIYFHWQYTYIVFFLEYQKVQKQLMNFTNKRRGTITSSLYSNRCLPYALSESGTRKKTLLDSWLNNTELYLTSLLVLNITQMQDKMSSPPISQEKNQAKLLTTRSQQHVFRKECL